ncbi:MAG TPA: UDP-3-O-(3-hydroxymyristoyl)glucosamine N-acyltransferase [Vicinamibacterales bacterium]
MTLSELAAALECRLDGDGSVEITGVSDLTNAAPGDITFFGHPRYRSLLATTRASAIIVPEDAPDIGRPMLRTRSPYLAFARALAIFHPPVRPAPGVSPHAAIAPDAILGEGVSIGPFVSIGRGAIIGPRSIVHAHVVIGDGAKIGADCLLYPHVSIREHVTLGDRVIVQNGAVVGSDGFGFTPGPDGRPLKVPQVGTVVIEDDVEIGANTTIDRATVGETRIGAGTKIDNLVQIGHNVRVGRAVLLAAQAGISGSATLEDGVTLGGQVGVAGHVTIGRGVVAAGQSGLTNSIEPGRFVTGYPAIDNRAWRKASVIFAQLPALRDRLKALERRLKIAEAAGAKPAGTPDPATTATEKAHGENPKLDGEAADIDESDGSSGV